MTFFYLFDYPAGDRLLCSIAQALRDNVVLPDFVGRLGGTAFCVLLPDTASDAASLILDRIRKKLQEERIKYAQPVNFHLSAVTYPSALRTVAELMLEAERRLNRLKAGRRDAVEIAVVDCAPVLI